MGATIADIDQQVVATSLFEESNDGLFLIQPADMRILDVNPTAQRLTGCRRKQLLGMRMDELLEGETERETYRLFEACETTCFFHSKEDYRLIRADGEPLAVNVSLSRIHAGPVTFGLVMVRDVSARKRAQRFLEESRRQLRTVIDTAGVVILGLSPEHSIIEWNRCAEEIYGVKREAVLGEDYFELFLPAECQGPFARDVENVLAGQPSERLESPVKTRNGQERVLLWNLSRLLDVEGRAVGIIACGQDITERKRSEQRTRDAAGVVARFALLSRRELDVKELVVAGRTNKQIAAELGIRPKTVEMHRRNLMRKLRVSSVAELVRVDLIADQLRGNPL